MSFDRDGRSDAEFERSLLESAGADAPPHDVRRAWERFAGALRLAAGPTRGDPASAAPPVSAARGRAAPEAARHAIRATAMRWLLVGLVGGSAVTATVMSRQRREQPVSAPPVVAAPAAPPIDGVPGGRESAAANSAASARAEPTLSRPVPAPAARARSTFPIARHAGPPRPHPRRTGLDTVVEGTSGDRLAPDSSTLAAEVSRIDGARDANGAGDYDGAIRLVERYHRDFPKGALAPDADVVALEAVAAKGDRAEVARRGALFLARYPTDPHAARVKALLAR